MSCFPLGLQTLTSLLTASAAHRYLIAFKNLLRSIEHTGISMVQGINYFGVGSLSNESYISFVYHDAIGRDLLNASFTYVPSMRQTYGQLARQARHERDGRDAPSPSADPPPRRGSLAVIG